MVFYSQTTKVTLCIHAKMHIKIENLVIKKTDKYINFSILFSTSRSLFISRGWKPELISHPFGAMKLEGIRDHEWIDS